MKNNYLQKAIEHSVFKEDRENAIRDKYIDLIRAMCYRSNYWSRQKSFNTFVIEIIGKKEFSYFTKKFCKYDPETNEIVP